MVVSLVCAVQDYLAPVSDQLKLVLACLLLLQTEDYLKRKIRSRPERSELVRMHILEGMAHAKQENTNNKLYRNYLLNSFLFCLWTLSLSFSWSGQKIMPVAWFCGRDSTACMEILRRICYMNSNCAVLCSWATMKQGDHGLFFY